MYWSRRVFGSSVATDGHRLAMSEIQCSSGQENFQVILPRKGKLSAINKEIENSEEFKEARRKHSAIESSINALENHGLDRCPDHGIRGFKRYVALAVMARNIQIVGHILQQKQLQCVQRLERIQSKPLRALL